MRATEYKKEAVEKTAKIFKNNPEIQELFSRISSQVKEKLTDRLTFIQEVEACLALQ